MRKRSSPRTTAGGKICFAAPVCPDADLSRALIALTIDPAKARQLARRVWAGVRATYPLDAARDYFLNGVSILKPDVLADLASTNDVAQWAAQWPGLDVPWVRRRAVATLALWRAWPAGRGKIWDHNEKEAGEHVVETGARRAAAEPIAIDPQHMRALIARLVVTRGDTPPAWKTIAPGARVTKQGKISTLSTVHEGARKLAAVLGLTISPKRSRTKSRVIKHF